MERRMKTHEKIALLDSQYVEARKRIFLDRSVWAEVIVHTEPEVKAALVQPKKSKDAIK